MEGCTYCGLERRDLLNVAGRAAKARNITEKLIDVLGEGAILEGMGSLRSSRSSLNSNTIF
jgi:hypothetical protein